MRAPRAPSRTIESSGHRTSRSAALLSRTFLALFAALAGGGVRAAPALLLQTPTISQDRLVFAYADDLWIAPREGGEARLLVRAQGRASRPYFSPDGRSVAYSARVGGNTDVYLVAADGGEPKRLTWHPGDDRVVGWSPDGGRVLFASSRAAPNGMRRLYTVPLAGGAQTALPLERADGGAYSPDASAVAYTPHAQSQPDWNAYRGGQTSPIWIARLSDSSIVRVPHENATDRNPMWIGDTVYFLSDRAGPSTLYAYDTRTAHVEQVLKNDGFPIDSTTAGAGAIVYSQMGALHLFDPATKTQRPIEVRLAADGVRLAPRYENVGDRVASATLSPTGARAVFEARGEILSVPAEKGDVRNLTRTPGAAERDPAWSPDGRSIAYFSDASGEYALHVRAQDGLGEARAIALGDPPSFFRAPLWSPDGKRIAYSDKRLNLWLVELDRPTPRKIDTDAFDQPTQSFDPAWSPDGRWLAYTKQLPNHLYAVFVHSLDSGKTTRVSDGMSDCRYPAFDKNGKYLYFTASTDMGLTPGWLDLSSQAHPVTRSVYVAVLRKDLPSPLAPQSDEDAGARAGVAGKQEKQEKQAEAAPPRVAIDLEGLPQRTLSLPVESANYIGLQAGRSGELFLLQAPQIAEGIEDDIKNQPVAVRKFSLDSRKTDKLLDQVVHFSVSLDGRKMLYAQTAGARIDDGFVGQPRWEGGVRWHIAKTDAAPKADEGAIATDAMQVRVDPRAEWAQIYREVWRSERDFFYDPHHHGYDLAAAQKRFEPYLAGIGSREDLDVLLRRMLSYLSAGHVFVLSPPAADERTIGIGLLGADYAVEHGRYRFAKVYDGENWNPDLTAPLTQPGVNVAAGDYLLAVNGRELGAGEDVYALFEETAGKQTVLRVAREAGGAGAREVTVVPIADERGLRHRAWVEANRRAVDRLSGGRLAYVHLPDTATDGLISFNRYFFAQTDKQGVLIDDRYNRGGSLADYVIDVLRRQPMTLATTREGATTLWPSQAIFGPKAMLINEFAGSGGDALPWYFKRTGLGPLIGKRTWGGLIGIYGEPRLIDGGRVTAPRLALSGLVGEWEVENHGVAPDIEVDEDPQAERAGHDPQLERGVEYLLKALAEHPPAAYKAPPYPDFKPVLPPLPY